MRRPYLGAAALILTVACSRPSKVEGDVYLLMQNGDVKRAASNTVYLVRDSASLRTGLAAVCERFERELEPLSRRRDSLSNLSGRLAMTTSNFDRFIRVQRHGSALGDSIMALIRPVPEDVRAVVARYVGDTARTNVSGHYVFPDVPPGAYFLFAETAISDKPYVWWHGLTVTRGASITQDLDNKSTANATIYCGAV